MYHISVHAKTETEKLKQTQIENCKLLWERETDFHFFFFFYFSSCFSYYYFFYKQMLAKSHLNSTCDQENWLPKVW